MDRRAHSTPADWPFVGRDDSLAVINQLLESGRGRGVILAGPAGVGKTRLADEFIANHTDIPAARVVALPSTQNIPFGALAHLLPSDTPLSSHEPVRMLGVVRSVFGGRRAMVLIDDIVFLDNASLSLMTQMISLGELFVIGTARDEHEFGDALDSMVRSFDIPRITVQSLPADHVAAAATRVIGVPLDSVSEQRLMDVTGGNPLYVRELLSHAVGTGRIDVLSSGMARLPLDIAAVPRLAGIIGARLRDVPDEYLPLLRMIAVAEPLLASDLERAGQLDQAIALEQGGWIRLLPRGMQHEVRVAHPLHSEVLRAAMGVLEYRQQVVRAAELVRSRTVPGRDDALRIAMWELDAGLEPEPEVLYQGALRARAAVDLQSTIRLAGAALAARPTPAAQLTLFEAYFLSGRFADALSVSAELLPFDGDLVTLISMLMIRVDNQVWGLGDAAGALDIIESYRPTFAGMGLDFLLSIPQAFVHVVDGRSAQADQLVASFADDDLTFLLTSITRVNIGLARGRLTEVEQICRRALDMLAALDDPRSSMDPMFFELSLCQVALGSGRLDDAFATCLRLHPSVIEERLIFLRGFVGLVATIVAWTQGNPTTMDRWVHETMQSNEAMPLMLGRRIGNAVNAVSAAYTGDTDRARQCLSDIDAAGLELGFMAAETEIGASWALYALGEHGQARARLRDRVEQLLAVDEPMSALMALAESCRLGDALWANERLNAFAHLEQMEGDLVAARVAFVRACAGRSGAAYLDAATRLERCGTYLVAAEAASQASLAFDRDGRARDAAAARSVMTRCVAWCGQVATPLLETGVDSVAPLTKREIEVAHLASSGLSSKEMGERLFLSPRTVENHLQRIYTKLGVTSRDELAATLAEIKLSDNH